LRWGVESTNKTRNGSGIKEDFDSFVSRLLLSPERASLGQLGLSSAGLAENGRTRSTLDNSRGVREHGGDLETTGALDVHEERPGGLDELLKLVLTGLSLGRRVEKVDSESLSD